MPTKGKRSCVFCGGQPVTREHAIPRWLARKPLFADYVANFKGAVRIQPRTEAIGQNHVLIKHHVTGTPQPDAITVKAVCRRCNGGWMSALEERVTTPLGGLLSGDSDTIPATDTHAIEHWAVKTSFMYQLVDTTTRTVQSSQLRACAATPSAVALTRVFAARYTGEIAIWPVHTQYRAANRVDLRQSIGLAGVTTLVFGRLALLVTSATNERTLLSIAPTIDPLIASWAGLSEGRAGDIRLDHSVDEADIRRLSSM